MTSPQRCYREGPLMWNLLFLGPPKVRACSLTVQLLRWTASQAAASSPGTELELSAARADRKGLEGAEEPFPPQKSHRRQGSSWGDRRVATGPSQAQA